MKYSIGIDLGGTNIRAAIVDASGNIIKCIKERTVLSGKDDLVEQIINLYQKVLDINYPIVGLGICVPGPVNPQNGDIYVMPNLNIENFPLKNILEKRLDVPIYIGNDANLAGLAEACVGYGKDYNVVQYLTLSTGIGGGLVIDKKIVTGKYGFAQEVGSMVIKRGDRRPSIFKAFGCIEGIASGNMLKEICKDENLIIEHTGDLFKKTAEGNETACKIRLEWIENMAAFIGSIVAYMEPDIFVLGGGLMKSKHYFLDDLIKKVDDYVFEYLKGKIKIVVAKYDQDAGVIGAAMQCL